MSNVASSRGSLNLRQLKLRSAVQEDEEVAKQKRKKNVLVLILDHLSRHGYWESVEQLQRESGVSLDKTCAADNIDLIHLTQEYEEYFKMKFGKLPKLVRNIGPKEKKVAGGNTAARPRPPQGDAGARRPSVGAAGRRRDLAPLANAPVLRSHALAGRGGSGEGGSVLDGAPLESDPSDSLHSNRRINKRHSNGLPTKASKQRPDRTERGSTVSLEEPNIKKSPSDGEALGGVSITGSRVPLAAHGESTSNGEKNAAEDDSSTFHERRVLKPLPNWGPSFHALAEQIQRDIYLENPNVRWDDISQLHDAKQLLKEAVVMPIKYPQFFSGLLAPWKGVLLYGPPGTGKTMLARAVATECQTTFFNISASSIVSKWRGDSEKLVRVLFELARYHAPSTIFIDEMDSIMGKRSATGEHEGSRRMKTELLIQMDGLAKSDDLVFVLAASNLPWQLDSAVLRRLEKRILVPLPTEQGRKEMIIKNLDATRASNLNYDRLAQKTQGYSGADIVLMCKEAAMRPVRRLMSKLSQVEVDLSKGNRQLLAEGAGEELPLSPDDLEHVSPGDVDAALRCVKSTAAVMDLKKYEKWTQEFGAGYSFVGNAEGEDEKGGQGEESSEESEQDGLLPTANHCGSASTSLSHVSPSTPPSLSQIDNGHDATPSSELVHMGEEL